MKRILIISYYWPPAGGVVVRRVMALAKYLPLHGFEPIVLCAGGDTPWLYLDDTVEATDVEVIRIDAGDLNELFSPEKTPINVRLRTAFRALFRTDYMANWADRVAPVAEKIIRERGIDIVITTSPPFSSLSILGGLKQEFHDITAVADLRDLFYSLRQDNLVQFVRRAMALPRIKRDLRKADLIVGASPGFEKELGKLGTPVYTVTNGFDCQIASDEDYRKGEYFRIVHTGSFPSTGQTPEFVLVAFDMACQMNSRFAEKARLIFAGVEPKLIHRATPKFAERPQNTQLPGILSHDEALVLQRSADINLLILTIRKELGGQHVIPAKFFEYIAARRPVLATCNPQSEVAKMVRDLNIGYVSSNAPDQIVKTLLALFNKWEDGTLSGGVNREIVERYSFSKRIAEYAAILEECAK